MSGKSITTNAALFSFVLALTLTGCQSESEPLPEVSVNIPDTVTEGDTEWKKQTSVRQSDNDCLMTFFSRNEDLAGNPEFEGEPTVFLSGKTDRRFYWMQSSIDGVRWRCVEFRKKKFSTSDGTGNPFQS